MLSESFTSETATVQIENQVAEIDMELTERGSVNIELSEAVELDQSPKEFLGEKYEPEFYELEGELDSGESMTLKKVLLGKEVKGMRDVYINDIKEPQEVVIGSIEEESIVDENVKIEIDMMCCSPLLPPSASVTPGEIQMIQREDWSLTGISLENIEERIERIKEYKTPLRTSVLEMEQQVNGTPEVQMREAMDKMINMAELLSFLQGVLPTPIRVRITEIDAERLDDKRYEKWVTNYQTGVGCAFKRKGITWGGETLDFLDESYDEYVEDLRRKYRLNMVIKWYLDSLNSTRSIDSRIASLCSGIELLAKRHSDLGPNHSRTEDRIKHLVDTLDVETEDLAEFSATFDSENDELSEEYFYYETRQYVVHGDNINKIGTEELIREYKACLRLMQRLLRNQLIDQDSVDDYSELKLGR